MPIMPGDGSRNGLQAKLSLGAPIRFSYSLGGRTVEVIGFVHEVSSEKVVVGNYNPYRSTPNIFGRFKKSYNLEKISVQPSLK